MKKKNQNNLSEETKNFVKTIIIVVVSFGICYLLFILMGSLGVFEKGYDKPQIGETEFTYNTALIGMVFNRKEKEYYVAFDEEERNEYYNTILNLYNGNLQIYKVNMSLGSNSSYKAVEGNYKATKSSELKIVSPTLIKIRNGKIVLYLEDLEKIEIELSN